MESKWTPESLQKEALKYATRYEFAKRSGTAYKKCRENKILDLICAHMKHVHHRWTDEELREEALKYSARTEFANNSKRAYQTAYHRRVLDDICSHMVPTRVKWTTDFLMIEAAKYSSRGKFKRGNKSAYESARISNRLDQICAHMSPTKETSYAEKELFAIIQVLYPSARKFRDRSVKILDKPHIKGFEVDIYVSELKLAIEYDGTYYHSFAGLKRCRFHWPSDDIRNYHQIKDDWFASKGIQILHIREEDWNLDKEECIKRCLDFLNQS